jgi:hypothetical protein
VPPETTTVAAPSFSPLHETFVLLKIVAIGPDKLSIVTEIVCEHRLASLTITAYVPAARFVTVGVPCGGVVFQLKEYGPTPPPAEIVALPFGRLQLASTCDSVTVIAGGSVIVVVTVEVHPLSSVIRQEYVPAVSPLAV